MKFRRFIKKAKYLYHTDRNRVCNCCRKKIKKGNLMADDGGRDICAICEFGFDKKDSLFGIKNKGEI